MIQQNKKVKGYKIVSAVSVVLFIASTIYLQVEINRCNKLETELKKCEEGLELEVSKKQAMEKEIGRMETDIVRLNSMIVSNARSYEESNQTLAATFGELDKVKKDLMACKALTAHSKK